MLLATLDPGRVKLEINLLAKRALASLTRDLRQPFGCLRVPEPGWPTTGFSL